MNWMSNAKRRMKKRDEKTIKSSHNVNSTVRDYSTVLRKNDSIYERVESSDIRLLTQGLSTRLNNDVIEDRRVKRHEK